MAEEEECYVLTGCIIIRGTHLDDELGTQKEWKKFIITSSASANFLQVGLSQEENVLVSIYYLERHNRTNYSEFFKRK